MGSTPKAPVPSILSKEQLVTDNEDEEIYILRVPNTLTSSSIMSLDMNLKSPNRIIVQEKEFSPIVAKDVETKSVLGQMTYTQYPPHPRFMGLGSMHPKMPILQMCSNEMHKSTLLKSVRCYKYQQINPTMLT